MDMSMMQASGSAIDSAPMRPFAFVGNSTHLFHRIECCRACGKGRRQLRHVLCVWQELQQGMACAGLEKKSTSRGNDIPLGVRMCIAARASCSTSDTPPFARATQAHCNSQPKSWLNTLLSCREGGLAGKVIGAARQLSGHLASLHMHAGSAEAGRSSAAVHVQQGG